MQQISSNWLCVVLKNIGCVPRLFLKLIPPVYSGHQDMSCFEWWQHNPQSVMVVQSFICSSYISKRASKLHSSMSWTICGVRCVVIFHDVKETRKDQPSAAHVKITTADWHLIPGFISQAEGEQCHHFKEWMQRISHTPKKKKRNCRHILYEVSTERSHCGGGVKEWKQ